MSETVYKSLFQRLESRVEKEKASVTLFNECHKAKFLLSYKRNMENPNSLFLLCILQINVIGNFF